MGKWEVSRSLSPFLAFLRFDQLIRNFRTNSLSSSLNLGSIEAMHVLLLPFDPFGTEDFALSEARRAQAGHAPGGCSRCSVWGVEIDDLGTIPNTFRPTPVHANMSRHQVKQPRKKQCPVNQRITDTEIPRRVHPESPLQHGRVSHLF